MGLEEPQEPSAAEVFARAIIGFPKHFFNNALSLLLALFTDWETFVLFAGAGLIAYATGAYLLVAGVLLALYSLLRVFGQIAHERSLATGLLGRVIRDNPGVLATGEQRVAITQLPLVLTDQAASLITDTEQPDRNEDEDDVGS